MENFIINETDRIDILITKNLSIPRTLAQKLIKDGNVNIEGITIYKPSYKGKIGGVVSINIPPPVVLGEGKEYPLKIVYEDKYLLVVDKPAGLITHRGVGIKSTTLVDALIWKGIELPICGRPFRPGIVHRLDKDTSGLIVVAKNDETYFKLVNMIKKREVTRSYLALVKGNPPSKGIIKLPLSRDWRRKTTMTVNLGGREALTYFDTIEYINDFTLLRLILETGRTHQIRVHLKYSGFPIVGDTVYGFSTPLLPRQFLHAFRLSFLHPETNVNRTFFSPLPLDLRLLLKILRDKKS